LNDAARVEEVNRIERRIALAEAMLAKVTGAEASSIRREIAAYRSALTELKAGSLETGRAESVPPKQ
jgi:hypothetical protein